MKTQNQEINQFNSLAHDWWNTEGALKTLHKINPTRIEFIKKYIDISDINILDVGCGGGILSEGLAFAGAHVSAIDLAPSSIEVAKLHLFESNLNINYQCLSIEDFIMQNKINFDAIVCMEMLEHVDDIESVIASMSKLLNKGGKLFLSTLNKTPKSYLQAILFAEHVGKIVPVGTHDYNKFIKPALLGAMLRKYNFDIIAMNGLAYNPFTHSVKLTKNTDVNYLVVCEKND